MSQSPKKRSPSRHPRKSISNVLPPGVSLHERVGKLTINSPSKEDETPHQGSFIRQLSVGRKTLSWPNWSTLGRSSDRPSNQFTIRIEPGILDYTKYGPTTAEEVFKEAANHIYRLKSVTERDPTSIDTTDDDLVSQMAIVVFGSNMIERVGSDLSETIHLCRKIFLGQQLSDVPQRSPEYQRRLEAYIRSNTNSEQKIRERREVVNHAMAFMHMVNSVIRDDKPFSESIIQETHTILCSGIPVVTSEMETIKSNTYAGRYRTRHVAAGNTNFVNPNKIGQAMTRFIDELNNQLIQAEKDQQIDPFFIAAHACGEFVNIHPFLDGNGRTCRIILNTILLKYAGIVCPIGEHDSERKEYIDIAKRRSDEESGNGALAWYALTKSISTLRRLRDKIIARKQ